MYDCDGTEFAKELLARPNAFNRDLSFLVAGIAATAAAPDRRVSAMKRAHNHQLDALIAAPALVSPDEVKALLLRLENVPVHTLVAAGCTGARLVELLAADRALAVEFARAAAHGRQIAKVFRRVAGIFSEGAQRTSVALQARPDRVEILAEVL